MIACQALYEELQRQGVSFFTGVPDSLLKDFCAYLAENVPDQAHIIAANEGGAVALAVGHFLATGQPGLVYMQNSGQGNAINPLTSLADPHVYGIPMLLLIGWRGQPGLKDEPQHVKQGEITLSLLDTLGLPYQILPDTMPDLQTCVATAADVVRTRQIPYALVVRKNTFSAYKAQPGEDSQLEMTREDAIKTIADLLNEEDIIISTTGKASRELFEYRVDAEGQFTGRDFLTVGSMGHASQIALGLALATPECQVYCFDGDGALIMHMGALAIIGAQQPTGFKHIVFNNGAHDSVGGQPTAAYGLDIPAIAQACGYNFAACVESQHELTTQFQRLQASTGPSLLEIRVRQGARADLGRPTTTPGENKLNFMQHFQKQRSLK